MSIRGRVGLNMSVFLEGDLDPESVWCGSVFVYCSIRFSACLHWWVSQIKKMLLLNKMSRSEKLCWEFLISFRLWRMDQNRISSLRSRLSDFAVWSESALDQSPHQRLTWWKEIISLWNKRSCASFFFSVKAFVILSDQIQGIKAAF